MRLGLTDRTVTGCSKKKLLFRHCSLLCCSKYSVMFKSHCGENGTSAPPVPQYTEYMISCWISWNNRLLALMFKQPFSVSIHICLHFCPIEMCASITFTFGIKFNSLYLHSANSEHFRALYSVRPYSGKCCSGKCSCCEWGIKSCVRADVIVGCKDCKRCEGIGSREQVVGGENCFVMAAIFSVKKVAKSTGGRVQEADEVRK